jgi:hypothetical protein
MMTKNKSAGFALVQALFFMMFIMAIVSVAMMMSVQRNTKTAGDRTAVDAYPAVYALLSSSITSTSASSANGTTYFANHPLSSTYIAQLASDGISDPSVDCTTDDCATQGPNLVLTIS